MVERRETGAERTKSVLTTGGGDTEGVEHGKPSLEVENI
jgi:hypothetical protein